MNIIAKARPSGDLSYQVDGTVQRVFDTNAVGDLIPVPHEATELGQFRLQHAAYGDVYAEVATSRFG